LPVNILLPGGMAETNISKHNTNVYWML